LCNNKIIVLEANKNEIRPGGKLMLALHVKVCSELKKKTLSGLLDREFITTCPQHNYLRYGFWGKHSPVANHAVDIYSYVGRLISVAPCLIIFFIESQHEKYLLHNL
jgi:hypothetical protein